MMKSIISNPDTVTDFHYFGGKTISVTVKVDDIETLEDLMTFDDDIEAKQYFENLSN